MDFISVCLDHISTFCLADDLPVSRSGLVRARRAIDWFVAFRFDGLVHSRTRNSETAPSPLADSAICVTRHHQRCLHVTTALWIHVRALAAVHNSVGGDNRQSFDNSERAIMDAPPADGDHRVFASDFRSILHPVT